MCSNIFLGRELRELEQQLTANFIFLPPMVPLTLGMQARP